MQIQKGQHKDIEKIFPDYNKEKSYIEFEAGNDNGKTFYGDFIVNISNKGIYRFYEDKNIKPKKIK